MKLTGKKIGIGVALGSVVIIGVLLYVQLYVNASGDKSIRQPEPVSSSSRQAPTAESGKQSIGTQWQWPDASSQSAEKTGKETDKAPPTDELQFNVVDIYNGLASVEIDEGGNLVLNDDVRVKLETAFATLPRDLSDATLSELENLIKLALPGSPGEQAADIVMQYHQYRNAEHMLAATSGSDGDPTQALAHYEQLVALRESYFGYENASSLFSKEQALAQYTLKSMIIVSDTDLSEEEKRERLADLEISEGANATSGGQYARAELAAREAELKAKGASQEELEALQIEVLGEAGAAQLREEREQEQQWLQRYQAYQQEKNNIILSGLSADDRAIEIDLLLRKHFADDEIDKAKSFDTTYSE